MTTSKQGDGLQVSLTLERFALQLDGGARQPGWRPWMIRLAPAELLKLESLCLAHGIQLIDSIDRQLAELALVRWPAAEAEVERERFVRNLLAAHGESAHYGTWVYFPWDSCIVHVLGRDDYFDVVTSRNQDHRRRAKATENQTYRGSGAFGRCGDRRHRRAGTRVR